MQYRRTLVRVLPVLAIIVSLGTFSWDSPASGIIEHLKVGNNTITLGEEGNSTVGNYDKMVGNTSKDELISSNTIYVAFTCEAEKVLFSSIFPNFKSYWKNKTGEDINFVSGFALSGFDKITTTVSGNHVQVLLITDGNDAVSRGYTTTKWDEGKKGIVFSTPEVFLVRKGNPLYIHSYSDLASPGVRVLHSNPIFGTQTGIWPIYGIYGSALKESDAKERQNNSTALERLKTIEANSFYPFTDSQKALTEFLNNTGDVLITTEAVALQAVRKNDDVEMVVPPNTIMTNVVVYQRNSNISFGEREVIDEFIDYLFTWEAQEALARFGFRPTDIGVLSRHKEFKSLKDPFSVEFLGQPSQLKKDLILDNWLKINNDLGNNESNQSNQ